MGCRSGAGILTKFQNTLLTMQRVQLLNCRKPESRCVYKHTHTHTYSVRALACLPTNVNRGALGLWNVRLTSRWHSLSPWKRLKWWRGCLSGSRNAGQWRLLLQGPVLLLCRGMPRGSLQATSCILLLLLSLCLCVSISLSLSLCVSIPPSLPLSLCLLSRSCQVFLFFFV